MTLLSACTNASNDVGVNAPTTIIGNTDPAALRLLQLARRVGRNLVSKAHWTALIIEHTFTANGSSDYALPADFAYLLDDTLWDRSRFWRMRGNMSPQQWQMYKSSVFGRATIERRWRIRVPTGASVGVAPVFSIDPVIGSTDTSSQFVFEYVSKSFCQSATVFSVDEMIPTATGAGGGFTVGDLFQITGGTSTVPAVGTVTSLTSGGTGILTAEVVTPGSYTVKPTSPAGMTAITGGGISATFTINGTTMPGASQIDWLADTDAFILDEDLLELGLIWRLQQRLGMAYQEEKDEYDRQVDQAVARDGGSPILSLDNNLINHAPNGEYFSNPAVILTDDTGGFLIPG